MNPLIVAPSPCCVPSKHRAQHLEDSRKRAAERFHANTGSTDRMVKLDGGHFLMGTESSEAFPSDGEGPVREVIVDPFYMDAYPVNNEQFREFVQATGYKTESER